MAFNFLNFDKDFILPDSGEEYLRQVQLEAQKCPAVVVADIDTEKYVVKQTVKVAGDNGCLSAPGGYAPEEIWQRQQIADFSKLRMSLSKYNHQLESKTKYKWPDERSDAEWCIFCFGAEFQTELNKKYTFLSPLGCTRTENKLSTVPPNLSVMVGMSQPLITKVLEYHIDWFDVTGYSVQQGRWLYALLACLEKPLTPETCSSIRTLARHCTKFRALLEKPQDESLTALNLFICLVARYFDQGDLADAFSGR